MELDVIYNEDCLAGMKKLPDKCIDLIVTDPPYEFNDTRGGGAFGTAHRTYHAELDPISKGVTKEVLDEMVRVMKKINIYIWCNKNQLRQYIDYFDDLGCSMDLLTWHKTNPVPTCGNKYLSDTEYCLFFREKGVKVGGAYGTKSKYFISELNTKDKEKYGHPTVKPLPFVEFMIYNSSKPDEVVLDPYIGSGTTAVAAMRRGRHYIGFEINPQYCEVARQRTKNTMYIQRHGLDWWSKDDGEVNEDEE